LLASQHRLQIALVIAFAAAAAILGDNAGYLIGRKGGRWLLLRPGPFARRRARVLEVGGPFFARHGSKAVFLGRWILGLRTWASWLAGASHMPWRSFSLWNAAGAISWATTIGLVAYYGGRSANGTIVGVAGLASTLGLSGVLLAPPAAPPTTTSAQPDSRRLIAVLGLPASEAACLFDRDGLVTETESGHAPRGRRCSTLTCSSGGRTKVKISSRSIRSVITRSTSTASPAMTLCAHSSPPAPVRRHLQADLDGNAN
jgi:membrane protein YqaA with SNARE-associated domain